MSIKIPPRAERPSGSLWHRFDRKKGKLMTITKRAFGTLCDGTQVSCWTLTNENGLTAEILDYGVIIRAVIVPDKNGQPVDVVLGYDTLEEYISDDCYLGATIGRFANRIKGASFRLNGKNYDLFANDGGNHIHGGKQGFNSVVWDGKQEGDAVVFSRTSPDGEEGYPGNLDISVTIGWQGNSLTITYDGISDQDTVVNFTNHSYFNLNGAGNGNINQHMMQMNADRYTINAEDCIPTGEVVSVAGSAMDFRTPKAIGRDADNDEPCVKPFHGYDTNFVISGHPVATTVGDRTGITMVTDTDQPGVQLYTANAMTDRKGKNGKPYGFRSAFCLETQHYPDCIHHPEWPTCILRAGEAYHSVTTYTFC